MAHVGDAATRRIGLPAKDANHAVAGASQTAQKLQERRLASTIWTEQDYAASAREGQREIPKRDKAAVELGNVVERDGWNLERRGSGGKA